MENRKIIIIINEAFLIRMIFQINAILQYKIY